MGRNIALWLQRASIKDREREDDILCAWKGSTPVGRAGIQ
jgi:hypothetical protein